jgi:dephospho-CoA kinase
MLIVGLTGGIGSGKTFVSELFASHGIPVYNADLRAKSLMTSDQLKREISKAFGKEAYADGQLNRRFLAEKVFHDSDSLKKLNNLVHPAVRKDHHSWHKSQSAPYTIREAAILFESGSYEDCDKIITISAPVDLRVERVMKRDKVSRKEVEARISNQWSDEEREKLADFVIVNDGSADINLQVRNIHQELLNLALST